MEPGQWIDKLQQGIETNLDGCLVGLCNYGTETLGNSFNPSPAKGTPELPWWEKKEEGPWKLRNLALQS